MDNDKLTDNMYNHVNRWSGGQSVKVSRILIEYLCCHGHLVLRMAARYKGRRRDRVRGEEEKEGKKSSTNTFPIPPRATAPLRFAGRCPVL